MLKDGGDGATKRIDAATSPFLLSTRNLRHGPIIAAYGISSTQSRSLRSSSCFPRLSSIGLSNARDTHSTGMLTCGLMKFLTHRYHRMPTHDDTRYQEMPGQFQELDGFMPPVALRYMSGNWSTFDWLGKITFTFVKNNMSHALLLILSTA